jgi:hypothetical protein
MLEDQLPPTKELIQEAKYNWEILCTWRLVSHSFALAVAELMERILSFMGCAEPLLDAPSPCGGLCPGTSSKPEGELPPRARKVVLHQPSSFSSLDLLRALFLPGGVPSSGTSRTRVTTDSSDEHWNDEKEFLE